MDLTKSIEPRSDQLNADDLIAGPQTVTIVGVSAGTPEQPVNVELAEYPGRPFKPSKSMRRVLVAAWGKDSAAYAGQQLTLFRDPEVTFGRDKVGGIRISHMTGIDAPLSIMLTRTRGKRTEYVVQPLAAPQGVTEADVAACKDVSQLRKWWSDFPHLRAATEQRNAELKGELA